ncbi:MAG: ATP-binding protein, partial [Bacteroidota bacterium]|nr:ATP-binding protein [Bacteroidota bacterium]
QGNLWFGTLNGGVSKYDGEMFTNYTTAQGLCNNTVRSISADEKGNLWFCTYGGGLSKYAGNSFTNFTMAQGLPNNVVFGIAEDINGNLWFGTAGGGAGKYDGNSFINYTKAQGLADNVIYCIGKDKMGNLWFGTSGKGISKYDGKSFTNYSTLQGLANNVIFSIFEDTKGNLWIGTSGGGVNKYDGKSVTNYTTAQGLASNVVFSINEDYRGNIWLGTLGGGVSKYDGNSFTNYTTAQGLADNVVWAITQDRTGNLWFGTQQGLSVMRNETADKKTATGKLFQSYTTTDGLPDNFVTQVVEDNDEKLYIGTNLGICELKRVNSSKGFEKEWAVGKIFNSQTGYPVKDVNAGLGAMFKDSRGIIWVGTGSDKTGLVRFDPKAVITNNLVPPAVFLKNVKINNENICWSDLDPSRINEKTDSNTTAPIITDEVNTFGRRLSYRERDSLRTKFKNISFEGITKWNPVPQKLTLPYYYNNISFDFNAIETGKNFLVKYQYMLKGYDKEWSPPGYKTFVNFGNIYEGTYTFMLRAQSPEGVWSKPIAYTFKVLPPWWRTWWMYVVYAAIFITIIILSFRWNNRRIIFQKKELERKIVVATRQIKEENEKVKAQKKKIEETLKELEATQSQLIQAEKMATLGELTAGIAHLIQNPLNFVNNFSQVNKELIEEMQEEIGKGNLADAKAISDDIKENEQKINEHGTRADAIVKGMLQHSRFSVGEKQLTNINALAEEYLELSYHGVQTKDPKDFASKLFHVVLKTDFDESIGKINIVPQDVGRMLLNLYNNAFYAIETKMRNSRHFATVSGQAPASEAYEPIVTVTTKAVKSQSGDLKVIISVKDNGNGISKKVQDKIFQPFFTTKPTGQGTGLGLSMSYDIIKAHGGDIKFETKEGEGSEFIVSLPC